MTLAVFSPVYAPMPGTADKPEFKILSADFGDGYTQWSADGMNSMRRVMTLTWDGLTPTQATAITSFFTQRLGVIPFLWTPSDETTALRWTCKDYTDTRGDGGVRKVTATFRQDFNLND